MLLSFCQNCPAFTLYSSPYTVAPTTAVEDVSSLRMMLTGLLDRTSKEVKNELYQGVMVCDDILDKIRQSDKEKLQLNKTVQLQEKVIQELKSGIHAC